MTTDRESREELRRLEAAASVGPWRAGQEYLFDDRGYVVARPQSRRDLALIAAMRNALAPLLDAADRADAETARADAAEERVAELEATVARVETLADEWDAESERKGPLIAWIVDRIDRTAISLCADELRAALSPAQGEPGVEG